MSRKLKQVRWFGKSNSVTSISNSSVATHVSDMTQEQLASDERAIQIGVQAPDGTEFQINHSNPITMGRTGIFEWSVENTGDYIYSFNFVGNEVEGNRNAATGLISGPYLFTEENYIADFYLETPSGGDGE